jgi:hypothetical protein
VSPYGPPYANNVASIVDAPSCCVIDVAFKSAAHISSHYKVCVSVYMRACACGCVCELMHVWLCVLHACGMALNVHIVNYTLPIMLTVCIPHRGSAQCHFSGSAWLASATAMEIRCQAAAILRLNMCEHIVLTVQIAKAVDGHMQAALESTVK